ncbi:MAG: DNA-packaging protein [Proteobacteria bacterium]|nr:DNA-packaging protein [Pseudomonadota bacterium]
MLKRAIDFLKAEQKRRKKEKDLYNWKKLARKNQRFPKGDWTTWLILAGRGFGKTRTGAETIRYLVETKKAKRIALIGGSISEVINVMIKGESGIQSVTPLKNRPVFLSHTNTLHWPNGAVGYVIGATTPEKLRGPQFDAAWVDELAKFKQAENTWNQLMLGLRLGDNPRCIITTTPKPTPLIQKLVNDPLAVITRGTTFDNQANLSPFYVHQIIKQFESTSLGSQELYGQLLIEDDNALWKRSMIRYQLPTVSFKRVVIAVDPAATHHEKSDETGIIVAGLSEDNAVFILDDLSGKLSPFDWGTRAVKAYREHEADRLVAEVNKGGDMVERIVKSIDSNISYKSVRATRGKIIRAEPIAALYEQNRVFHIKPLLELEEQLCSYSPVRVSKSPDRLDALVWAVTELLLVCESNPILKVW